MTATIVDDLKNAIMSKDKDEVLSKLTEMLGMVATNDELMLTLIQPVVITELHHLLTEHLGVQERLMQLRVRAPNSRRRAHLFVQCMINGVNYL